MKYLLILLTWAAALTAAAQDNLSQYDLNAPFGFCNRTHRTLTTSMYTYSCEGGGCSVYPVPETFTGKWTVLKSTGSDMADAIREAIGKNAVVIFDGSEGDFIVSSTITFSKIQQKTLIGINGARLCTQWHTTDAIRAALDAAGVPTMSTSGGGGTLSNDQEVKEQAEYNTRKIILEMTGDNEEKYRYSGIFGFSECRNIIIRNITFVGPGSIDVGGADLVSFNKTKNCWVDHCAFMDGMDGNFDITQQSDFNTVSWCTFSYTENSYMHQNTNLIGSSDSESKNYLNTTFAFNWWGQGCKQRMPMARVGKIHMLNNYFTSTTAGNCINPRKNSEFLIEGNYFAEGVKNYYSQSSATAVTWADSNHAVEENSLGDISSFGSTVTVPYEYTVAPAANVPEEVGTYAGPTLDFKDAEPDGIAANVVRVANSTTYYNMNGQQVEASTRGLILMRQQMTDGSFRSVKIIR